MWRGCNRAAGAAGPHPSPNRAPPGHGSSAAPGAARAHPRQPRAAGSRLVHRPCHPASHLRRLVLACRPVTEAHAREVGRVLTLLGPAAMASHHSAALLWGLDLLAAPETVSVCIPRNRSRVLMPDVLVYRRDVPLWETAVLERWAIRVTGCPGQSSTWWRCSTSRQRSW